MSHPTPQPARAQARHGTLITRLCRLIESAGRAPTLAELARVAALSPWHLHRLFVAATGLTPREYAAACRRNRLATTLAAAPDVTTAVYAAGYGSSSRFYAEAGGAIGMRPGAFRDGARGTTIRQATVATTLGLLLVAATDAGVCAILLGEDAGLLAADLRRRFPRAEIVDADAGFASTLHAVATLVESPQRPLALPLDIQGTAFQQRVWRALRDIPPGTTRSYAEIARAIGNPRATRAVAGACAANPLAVAIPCHRVVRSDGDLAGYRWGTARKRELLRREKP
jgi:AraC family transcriptional regulator, regulatory protein of adaptative response / methylated-DNA-[protein]-cysteine methyltransferase